MAWYWTVLLVLWIISMTGTVLLLVLAHSVLHDRIEALTKGLFALAHNVDTRFATTGKNVDQIAKFLVGAFNLEEVKTEDPTAQPPPSSSFKN